MRLNKFVIQDSLDDINNNKYTIQYSTGITKMTKATSIFNLILHLQIKQVLCNRLNKFVFNILWIELRVEKITQLKWQGQRMLRKYLKGVKSKQFTFSGFNQFKYLTLPSLTRTYDWRPKYHVSLKPKVSHTRSNKSFPVLLTFED